MNVTPHKLSVSLSCFQHRGKDCFAIKFPYNNEIRTKVKSISKVRWSATHKTFYVFCDLVMKNELYRTLTSLGLYVDYSALQNVKPSKILNKTKLKKEKRKLSNLQKQCIRGYVKYLRGLRLSESTVKVYFTFIADFVAFIGDRPITQLNNTDVRFFVEHQVINKKYAISTHRQMISAIKHFSHYIPDSQITNQDLKRPLKSRYLPSVLSKEEVIDLLRATKNLKHRATLALLYSSGLRIGEVIALRLSDIDIDRRQVVVRNGKGRKDRFIVLAKSFIPLLKNYITTYTPKHYFIEGPTGDMYSASSIRAYLKRSCKLAKIEKRVTPHTLRHSYATHLIENGIGLRYVQELLGHSKPETTMIYTHVAKKDLLDIQSPLDTAVQEITAKQHTDKSALKPFLSHNTSG